MNFIEILKIFVGKENEQAACLFKDKFNETRPLYCVAEIKTYETQK